MPPQYMLKKRKLSVRSSALEDKADDDLLEAILSDTSDEDDTGFEDFDSPSISSDEEANGFEAEDEQNLKAQNDTNIFESHLNSPKDTVDEESPNYRIEEAADGGARYVYDEIDPVYDSDDTDAQEPVNTIGNIPLSFYDSYPHIGYDINGKKVMRPAAGEALDALLDSIEVPKGWTGLTDPETGKPLNLTQEQLEMIRKIQMNEVPQDGYDPYPEMIEWFTSTVEQMPLSAAPEPKRRFIPSKHEQKRVMKLVRAIKQGRILPYKPPEEREKEEAEKEEEYFDIWADEQPRDPHIMNIPAPKLLPPGYDLSYNPPPEYLPTKDEKKKWENTEPEERDKEYLPQKFDALRKVPAYTSFVKERFERCLDLYLAPRIRRNRLNIDPESLLPKLPKPEDLRPFPTLCQKIMRGHEGRVRSVSFDPTGIYIASGGEDGTIRVWDGASGHELWRVRISSEDKVSVVRWRPTADTLIIAAAAGENVFFAVPQLESSLEEASREALDKGFGYAKNAVQLTTAQGIRKDPPGKWERPGSKLEKQGVLLQVTVRSEIRTLSWHRRGDYFCTVSPAGQRSAIAIHNLAKHVTNNPIKKLKGGIPQYASFHPTRPHFFIAMQRSVRCYDLQEHRLDKVLRPGTKWISAFDIHPGGDNLAVATHDRRLVWHDMDKSADPYKTMRFHSQSVRIVKFHKREGERPLMVDASDDGTLVVFHAKVVSDLSEDATIVPVKTLKGHKVVDRLGVLDVDWHPTQAHCISAGADGTIRYWG